MHITLIPLLDDNYGYLVMDQAKGVAAVVDPVEPQKVKTAVDIASVEVTHVLTTHKHWDHAGGNEAFKGLTPNVIVVGGEIDDVEACTMPVKHGDQLNIGDIKVKRDGRQVLPTLQKIAA
ncbi:unnamed protein product [Phaeothamnion confervicola]